MRGGARFIAVALALAVMGFILWFALGSDPATPPLPDPSETDGNRDGALPEDLESGGRDADHASDITVVPLVDDLPIPADAVPVHGRVIDTAGRPVKGARVRALATTTGIEAMNFLKLVEQVQNPIVAIDESTSDATGAFILRRTTPGMYRFLAEAETFAPRYTQPLPVAKGRDGLLEIVLSPGFPLSGTVTLESGDPVQGVEIAVFPSPSGDVPFIEKTTAVTDADGRYVFSALPPGRLTGFVRPKNRPVQVISRLNIPEQSVADVVLQGSAGLRLIVKNEAGEAVSGASVTVVGRRPVQTFTFTQTGDDGVVELQNLGDGKLEMLAVMHDAYLPYPDRIWNPGEDMKEIVLVGGETIETNVILRSGVVLRGRTVDAATGEPVAGVFVRAITDDMDLMFGGSGVRSDADGAFMLPAMRNGRSILLAQSDTHSMPAGVASSIRDREVSEEVAPFIVQIEDGVAPADVTLPLNRGATVTGRVLSPDGQPVPSASVTVTSQAITDRALRAMSRVAEVVTDVEGHFTIDGFPPGLECSVNATAEGWLPGKVEKVTIEPGGVLDDLEITLAEGQTLEGEVVDVDGKPIENALVQVAPEGRRNSLNLGRSDNPPARTDASGRFSLHAQPEGKMAVRAECAGFVPSTETVEITAGQRATVTVSLSRDAPIAGRVVDESGLPVSGAWVRAQIGKRVRGSGGGISARANSGSDGTFSIEGLPAGKSCDLTSGAEGFVNAPSMSVTSGTSGVEIQLQRGLEISGRILDPAGRGLANMRVRVFPRERAGDRQTVTTDEQGGFRVRGLESGPFSVRVVSPPQGDLILNEDLVVDAGELGVIVTLREGLSVQGRVLDSNGKAVVGAAVNATRIDKGQPVSTHHSNSNKEGEFALRGMPEGNYRVIVSHRGSQPAKLESVKAGARDVTITVSEGLAIAGTVIGKDGKPLANARVLVRGVPPMRFYRSTRSDSEGAFRLTGLEQGKYRVEVYPSGPRPRPSPQPGQERGVEVRAGDEAVRVSVD